MINEGVKNAIPLSPSQQALLERRLREAVGKIHETRKIPRRSDQRYAPLSFAQQRLWLFNQIEPGNTIYNLPTALHLQGKLNVKALEKTINEIVRRHEVLRTRFDVIDGEPRQEVLEATPTALDVVDISDVAETEHELAAREAALAQNRRPFDLDHGPFLRVKLLRLGDEEHVVLLTMHHLVSDGWSMGVLVKEVVTLYEAYSQGADSPLPELPIQYADFAVWQRNLLQGEELERQLSYWREQLSGTLPVLELPADRVRSATQTHSGAHRSIHLSLGTTAALKELSRREGVTLFMTLIAAFQILLYRYTQQEKIIIGTPVAGRNHTSVENLIGFFINQLALCFDLSADLTFQQVLQQTKRVALDALAHQDIPFDKLVEEFQRQRALSYSPIFQVGFALHNLQPRTEQMLGLTSRSLEIEGDVAKLDLMMHVTESENRLRIAIVYSTELFDETRIERMLRHFETLVQGILASSEHCVWELPLLQEEELVQAIKGWNETRRDYGPTTLVHELFEAQMAARPDATAVVCGDEKLSYAELNQRANQLAHYLRKKGVGAEVVVGLCMERSLEMVVGLLGILKAGGAYLPLDPDYPQQRLEYMLSDAQVGLVLTQSRLLDQLPVHWGLTIVLDDEWATITRESKENPELVNEPRNLVYVIYTSGSTGQPKGVMVTHSSLSNLAAAQIEAFGVRTSSRVLQFASLNFDASISEICMTLCHGAQLHLANSEQVLVGPALSELLQQQGISVATLPPTVLKQLTDGEEFRKLETLIVAGEACGEELVEQWREGRHFYNAYGPTEATVCATIEECNRGGRPAIGRAIGNVEVYILDGSLNVMPVGVSGEICVGGTGVARGYWQRADLTAERFVPHPYSTGERLYRTGDEGRYREDGRIDFLGRHDQQVKVRGYRIELGEIEAVLESHGGVQQAIVTVRDEEQLVGYVVGAEEESWFSEREITAALRPFLIERLPEYMVPQRWVMLDHLPLNANGKVDRERLPVPSAAGLSEHAAESEWTPVEELIAGIWSEVLKREALGRDDNFFELGGHSLLATQVISRVREVFGVEMELRRLFEAPTVCSFSRSIEEELRSGAGITVPPLQRVGAEEREQWGGGLPLSFAQQRMWFLNQLEPDSTAYNTPTAVKLTGELKIEALERTLSEIVRRHEVLRTRFVNVGGEPRQEVLPATPIKLAVTDLTTLDEAEQEAAVREATNAESWEPFDLAYGPMRVKLLRLGDEEHVVLLTLHHIVSDGWSLGVLIREVAVLYSAYSGGAESPLPELKVQYSDFAVWQRGWLQGAELERQLGYWREQLGGELAALELPTDHVRPAVPSNRGAQERFRLSNETTAALRELSRREGVTVFMTLLAAFQTLLHRYSGQADIVVGSPVAGRNYAETENLIGFFVNTLPLRVQLRGELPFVELLQQVKEVCLGAYAHQDVPFEKLVEELQPRREGSRSPLYQVVLTLQNAPRVSLGLSGLRLEKVDSGLVTTGKYELSFSLGETSEGLGGFLEYHEELFEAETIRRLLGDFTRLLELVVENPAAAVGRMRFLSAAEEHEVLVERNETKREYESGLRLHEWLAREAKRHWEQVAVVAGEREITYGELENDAEEIAAQLREQGVSEGWRVGILLEHNYELIVGLVGVLKTGAAYVPLAAGQGELRNQQLLRDSGVQLVLTPEWLSEPGGRSSEAGAGESAAGLVYVMYTSGTTGKAKGVEVEEASLLNYLHWALEQYVRGEQLSFGLCTSVSFDLTVTALYLPLLSGGRIVLYEPGAEAVGAILRENQVEVLKLTPSHLEQLRDSGHAGSRLRRLIVGGEALSERLAREVVESFGGGGGGKLELYNEYGPTEATVGCMVHRYELGEESGAGVSIGRAAANTEIYVLDEGLEPVGENVVGEIYIGGAGLARGYWQRAEQTAERFVPHPYSAVGGERLYRSGDLGRWRRGGKLEYVGRRDEQVKYKGHRVELQELRAALNEHADVRESVVRLERDGETAVLVAYYVSRHELAASELRAWLSERVVKETVPSVYVHLKKLPLGLNGKVNYQELPGLSEWRRQREQAGREEAGEWTAVEELVAGIWSEVLRLGTVGRGENFFELGGHSLLATQVISRVREVFGVEVGLRRLFEAPTVRSFSRSIEAALRAEEKVTVPALRALTVEEREQWGGLLPLSFAQQRLWFLDQLEPGNTSYNVPLAVRLRGELQVEALERTFNEVVRRHEVLRTRFVIVEGEPRQEVLEAAPIKLAITDLSSLSDVEREAAIGEAIAAENSEPFDLAHGPMLRTKLLRLSDEEHVVLLTMHHIVSDEWSMGLLIKEVATLYEAYGTLTTETQRTQRLHREEDQSPLPELKVQYGDFAVWQRGWLQGEVLEKQLAYWRKQLGGTLPTLELPTDRPRPALQSYRGGQARFRLTPEITAGLKELSRREGATLFMTMLAAFQTLLHRYSGQPEVVTGTPLAGRNYHETESLIGFFVNTLPLRVNLTGEPTFVELLQRVKEVCLGAYAHQDVPFEKLVEELQPERDLSRSPLFQATCMLQNPTREDLQLTGLELSRAGGESPGAKFDLSLALQEKGEELHGSMVYSMDLFESTRMERMLHHFEALLRGIAANPEQRLWELPLLDAREWETIIGWNGLPVDFGPMTMVQELFESQVERAPNAVAVVCGAEQLSYAELNRRANQLAHYLRKRGVGADLIVGLCLERSLDLVVALLGVLKAGGAYLPLDPNYPQSRLEYMLEDAQVELVLTQGRLLDELEPLGESTAALEVQWLPLDQGWGVIAAENTGNPKPENEAENLAYVIYTSGSTGQPKGVMLTHRGLHNLASQAERFGIHARSRVLQFASLNFDASTFELVMALCNGGQLHLASSEQLVGPALSELLQQQEISAALLPPTLLKQMKDGEEFRKLETLIAGGEACGEELVEQWSEGRRFLNAYGPTEATVAATLEECHSGNGRPAIGRGLVNVEVYILDEWLNVVPIGVSGEIYIGGAGLARGYWQRAELTAERFVPHPYSATGGERLYRTGDEGRYLEDGRIECLGRLDHQVKVRGYRIELGEIEAALESHTGIRQAVVTVRDEQQLVGYVVGEEGVSWLSSEREVAAELRAFLQERLPEYMVPHRWVVLDHLPMTTNGKIDRKNLPEPFRQDTASSALEPLTPMEKALAGIWSNVLQVNHVGRNDNFFELGGDSILSIQIVSQAYQLGIQLSPRDIFRHQTIGQLATVAVSINPDTSKQETVEGEVPLTPIQRWFFEREWSNIDHFNQSIMLATPPDLDVEALKASISKLVHHHDALRMRFSRTEEKIDSYILPEETNEILSKVDLSEFAPHLQTNEIEATASEVQASLNIQDGPLLRIVHFNLGPQTPGRLLIVIHHLVVDGVSWRILVEDLQTTYLQAVRGEELRLPSKTTSIKEWAESLERYAQSDELAAELDHWAAISNAQIPSLRVDFTDRENRELDRRAFDNALSPEDTRALLQDVPKFYHTEINDVLIAAFARTLSTWSGNSTFLIDLEGHGREPFAPEIDLSRTVGWFTTLHPVLLQVQPNSSRETLLHYVGEQLRVRPNKGLGYGVLKYLGDEQTCAALRNGHDAEVCFNYLGQFRQPSGDNAQFSFASESSGQTSSEWGKRAYLIDISCIVAGDRLGVKWTYSKNIHRLESIEELAQQYLNALREIIACSQLPTAVAASSH